MLQKSNLPLSGMKAMLFAAGLGTRLKPFTDKHPKALAPVNGKPLLQRNIEYLASFGIHSFLINTHHFADQIADFLTANDDFGMQIVQSHEALQPLETGGGLMHAAWFFEQEEKPFVVMNADMLTNMDIGRMYAFHEKEKPMATLAVSSRQSSRHLLFDDTMTLCGWENSQTGEKRISRPLSTSLLPYAFSGIHIIEPSLLGHVTQRGKFSIIDMYLELAPYHALKGYRHEQDLIIDVGRPASITEAEKYFS